MESFLVDVATSATGGIVTDKPLLHELRSQGQQAFDAYSSSQRREASRRVAPPPQPPRGESGDPKEIVSMARWLLHHGRQV